ncbi:MAG: class I poly(R)-hydroxyalkanoic acid synthase, partial [Pseudomonadota bacterium]
TRKKADFHMRQVSSALSPSNFPMTNPEIMRQTLATNGENLVRGMSNLLTDFQKSGDLLKISQTDIEAFEVGRDLAVTPGKVVYQNELFQLIQYSPTTDKVYETPILITPPWINKFYILDLTPAKSLIRYLVEKGFTVFLISWVNPGEDLAHKTFEDYMTEGILSATEVVRQEANVDKTHVLGYCVGGTLLACTLSYLAAIGEEPYASATFLTAQVDFTSAGDLLMFTDDEQLQSLDEVMEERGFLDGSRMANVFNMLRPRDLIWPYIVNNYMLGKKPFAFDLLFWNQDSTRMAPANHHFYLYEFYNKNRLAAGELKLAGVELDVSKVKTPIYELAAKEDHIAPALSVYKGARMFGGEVTYVLAGSGHIAGVINPPEKFKYQYWLNPRLEETFDDWFMHAREHPGSWWPHWTEWLAGRSGSLEEAREPGARFGVIEDAPGSYVREKG